MTKFSEVRLPRRNHATDLFVDFDNPILVLMKQELYTHTIILKRKE
jgi:hypothetical protein